MHRALVYIVLFIVVFMGCEQGNTENNNASASVYRQYERFSKALPLNYDSLKVSQKVLKAYQSNVPDTVIADQNFLLGNYFKTIGQLDSAAIYFHDAIDHLSDSLTRNSDGDYFYQAWQATGQRWIM